MRPYFTALTAATLVTVALAAPADAQMRRSTPAPGVAAPSATPATNDQFRPTSVFEPNTPFSFPSGTSGNVSATGVERAQTLPADATVLSINGTGLSFNYGVNNALELGLSGVATLANMGAVSVPNGTQYPQFGLGAGARGKYLFSQASNLSVAGLLGLGIAKNVAGDTFQTFINAGVPVSFWIGQRGGFHVVPVVQLVPDAANKIQTVPGIDLAYEMALNPTWRLMLANNLRVIPAAAGGQSVTQNTYQAGVRVAATPNTTVDVTLVNGYLNFGTPNNSDFGQGNVTLLNFSAYFGGTASQVRQSFGI